MGLNATCNKRIPFAFLINKEVGFWVSMFNGLGVSFIGPSACTHEGIAPPALNMMDHI